MGVQYAPIHPRQCPVYLWAARRSAQSFIVLFFKRLRMLIAFCPTLRFVIPWSRSCARKDPSDASNRQMTAGTVNEPQSDVLEASKRGDQEALRVLFETHKDRVYSF